MSTEKQPQIANLDTQLVDQINNATHAAIVADSVTGGRETMFPVHSSGRMGNEKIVRIGGTTAMPLEPMVHVAENTESGQTVIDARTVKEMPGGGEGNYSSYRAVLGDEHGDRVTVSREGYTHTYKNPEAVRKMGALIAKHVEKRAQKVTKAAVDKDMGHLKLLQKK